MRHRTGLRNRRRSGRSSYSIRGKARERDSYGEFSSGKRRTPDIIAGRTMGQELIGLPSGTTKSGK
jgi:hypothetical protein